jgi:hypothetical protein
MSTPFPSQPQTPLFNSVPLLTSLFPKVTSDFFSLNRSKQLWMTNDILYQSNTVYRKKNMLHRKMNSLKATDNRQQVSELLVCC